jgi:hypothetical protein
VVNVKKSASEEDSEIKQADSAARVQRLAEEMRFCSGCAPMAGRRLEAQRESVIRGGSGSI